MWYDPRRRHYVEPALSGFFSVLGSRPLLPSKIKSSVAVIWVPVLDAMGSDFKDAIHKYLTSGPGCSILMGFLSVATEHAPAVFGLLGAGISPSWLGALSCRVAAGGRPVECWDEKGSASHKVNGRFPTLLSPPRLCDPSFVGRWEAHWLVSSRDTLFYCPSHSPFWLVQPFLLFPGIRQEICCTGLPCYTVCTLTWRFVPQDLAMSRALVLNPHVVRLNYFPYVALSLSLEHSKQPFFRMRTACLMTWYRHLCKRTGRFSQRQGTNSRKTGCSSEIAITVCNTCCGKRFLMYSVIGIQDGRDLFGHPVHAFWQHWITPSRMDCHLLPQKNARSSLFDGVKHKMILNS